MYVCMYVCMDVCMYINVDIYIFDCEIIWNYIYIYILIASIFEKLDNLTIVDRKMCCPSWLNWFASPSSM